MSMVSNRNPKLEFTLVKMFDFLKMDSVIVKGLRIRKKSWNKLTTN